MKLFLLSLIIASVSFAETKDSWNLPLELNDKNSKFTFEVDSTWVLVEGTTSANIGRIYYSNPADLKSLSADLILPVKNFKTGMSMRDDHMYEVMAEKDYPNVEIKFTSSEGECSPSILEANPSCILRHKGSLKIRDITKDILAESTVVKLDNSYQAKGELKLLWADYNVEDPSNLIAKLKPEVKVNYEILLEVQAKKTE